MKKIILYTYNLSPIGGIETFIRNFCKRLAPHYDITFMFCKGHLPSIVKLSDYVNVIKFDDTKTYFCDIVLLASAWGTNPENNIKAKKFIQMVHADYNAYIKNWNFKYIPGKKTSLHVAVGKHVAFSFQKATMKEAGKIETGLTAKVIYNLLDKDHKPEPKREKKKGDPIYFITASRISREKGFPERFKHLAELLVRSGLNFRWDIYGDVSTPFHQSVMADFQNISQVRFLGITREAQKLINKADYMIQLSYTEGCPYCVLESLQALTPAIITKFPSSSEFIENGRNGWIMEYDLSNFAKEKFEKILKLESYKEKSSEQDWIDLLG